MTDFSQVEQRHIQDALRYLRRRLGTTNAVAKEIGYTEQAVGYAINGRYPITAKMALRVARLAGVTIDNLVIGKFRRPDACPNCGHIITQPSTEQASEVIK